MLTPKIQKGIWRINNYGRYRNDNWTFLVPKYPSESTKRDVCDAIEWMVRRHYANNNEHLIVDFNKLHYEQSLGNSIVIRLSVHVYSNGWSAPAA